MKAQIAAEAGKAGMTIEQYVGQIRQQVMARQQQAAAQQAAGGQQGGPPPQQGAQPGQQVPIAPGPPKPEAVALANFLQSQNLKTRTCIFQEKRKEMFKVKRAIRALHSDAYKKARAKNPLLPEVVDRVTAENTFKKLPLSLLALRVEKDDPHAGHDHGKAKRTKGLWTVKVVPQQEAADEFYYVWMYEGAQWKNKLYAVGALLLILLVVFFPVWPYKLRIGVWYLSMGMLGLLGLFFGMAIVRLIIFLITMFTVKPGLWLYPNLFEDVGFFDSFRPVWAWHEDEAAIKKRKKEEREKKRQRREAKSNAKAGKGAKQASAPAQAIAQTAATTTTGTDSATSQGNTTVQQRNLKAQVEEVESESE
jgi:translocation protein SEC62